MFKVGVVEMRSGLGVSEFFHGKFLSGACHVSEASTQQWSLALGVGGWWAGVPCLLSPGGSSSGCVRR